MKKQILYLLVLAGLAFCIIPSYSLAQESIRQKLTPLFDEIQERVKQKKNPCAIQKTPLIIAIAGCPGVGKSTISELLRIELLELGIVSVIIHQDHYGLSQSERKQFSNELDPRRIQWKELHRTFANIYSGETKILKPTINQLTKEIGEETLDLSFVDCILFEGSYTLGDFAAMNFLQYADLGIYLESSLENIYNWKWERELKKSKPRSSELFFHHMMEIVKDFVFHVYPTKKNADYIVYIDAFHQYLITNKTAKNTSEPDFTSLRLETFHY